MLNKKAFPYFLLISLLLAMVGCSSNKTGQESYTIGAILPLTGAGINLGQPAANGMRLAIQAINEHGGIQGREVKLIIQDSRFDVRASATAAKYLSEVENIDMGSVFFGLPSDSAGPVFEQTKTPFIFEAYSRMQNPYAFKANYDALEGCEKLIRYAKENKSYQRLGVLMSETPYNDLCLQGIKKVEPDTQEYRYTFGEKDFKTLFSQAHQAGVDRLMTIGIDFEYIAMFRQLTELGLPVKMMCATANECIFPDVVKNSSSQVLEGTLSMDYISPDISQTEIAEKLRQEYGDDLKFTDYAYGAIGYEEVQIMSKAFESCQPGERECIRQALGNVKDYNSVIGSHGFKDRVLQLDYQIYEWRDGEWRGVDE